MITAWSELGRLLDVPTPTIDFLIHIGGLMTGENYMADGVSLVNIGIDGMSPQELLAMLG